MGLKAFIPPTAVHLCVDMQRMFVEDTDWHTPWARRVLPVLVELCAHNPERTCFTRFVPARRPDEARGAWKTYWERWRSMTLEEIEPDLLDIALPLQRFTPPGRILDKPGYSAWLGTDLHAALQRGGVDSLMISGAETDVCVLATVMGAVDLGYRVIVVEDGLCSSADRSHDDLLAFYHDRLSQVETAPSEEIQDGWKRSA